MPQDKQAMKDLLKEIIEDSFKCQVKRNTEKYFSESLIKQNNDEDIKQFVVGVNNLYQSKVKLDNVVDKSFGE